MITRRFLYALGMALLCALTLSNFSASARGPVGCNKRCGWGLVYGNGTRNSTDCSECKFVTCSQTVDGCSDSHNDDCQEYIWC